MDRPSSGAPERLPELGLWIGTAMDPDTGAPVVLMRVGPTIWSLTVQGARDLADRLILEAAYAHVTLGLDRESLDPGMAAEG